MNERYPILIRRYLATFVDFCFIFTIAIVIGKYVIGEGVSNIGGSVLIFIIPFLLYEPIFTSFSATLGQFIFRFRVRKLDEKSKISLFYAYCRYFVKGFLGIVSLMTIPAREDRRAIHDLAADSIVVEA